MTGGSARGSRGLLSGYFSAEYRDLDRTRTLELSPEFADTKHRRVHSTRVNGSAQFVSSGVLAPAADELLVGVDVSHGKLSSSYFDFLTGDAATYAAADPEPGDLAARGSGIRTAAAAFASYAFDASESVRLSAGLRFDWLSDEIASTLRTTSSGKRATSTAVSPKLGLNWNYSASARSPGSMYLNVSRSFKAPTHDQLFDLRTVPAPPCQLCPPEFIFSNEHLDPQYGMTYEAGVYQSLELAAGDILADVRLTLYHMDMEDEIDFDIQSFGYGNIGQSTHRGVESGVMLYGIGLPTVFINYTLQAARAESGDNAGRYLKAIPRHMLVAGGSVGEMDGLYFSLVVTSVDGMYLDDANTETLAGWTRWDARASYGLGRLRLFADARNLFDTEYSTTGFPDPAGTDAVYFYPAAGRTLRFGISREW